MKGEKSNIQILVIILVGVVAAAIMIQVTQEGFSSILTEQIQNSAN